MSLELTPSEFSALQYIHAKIEWRKRHPNRIPEEKRLHIIEMVHQDVSVSQITKKLHVSHQTINDIRKECGAWGA